MCPQRTLSNGTIITHKLLTFYRENFLNLSYLHRTWQWENWILATWPPGSFLWHLSSPKTTLCFWKISFHYWLNQHDNEWISINYLEYCFFLCCLILFLYSFIVPNGRNQTFLRNSILFLYKASDVVWFLILEHTWDQCMFSEWIEVVWV